MGSECVITTVGQLRSLLAQQHDDAPILSQVVGTDSGVWNMQLGGALGKDCGFQWTPHQPVILQMKHPLVRRLPSGDIL